MRIQNRSPFSRRTTGSYSLDIQDKKESTVYIYDEIGYFGVGAEQFVKDLNNIKTDTVNIRINSPGGYVFDGTAIYNAIKQHPSNTVVHIDGIALSIASVIALAADEVRMADNAYMMIHEPWSMVAGNSKIMRDEADLLDKVGGTIRKVYAKKAGIDEAEASKWMKVNEETWFTAEEALENGLVDFIYDSDTEEDVIENKVDFDLSIFAKVPDALMGKKEPTARDMEQALRDVGCTRKQAKAIVSKGLGNLRDADEDPKSEELRDEVVEDKVDKNRKKVGELVVDIKVNGLENLDNNEPPEPVERSDDNANKLLIRAKKAIKQN